MPLLGSPISSSSTSVDLSRLAPPDVVEQLSFEQIYADALAEVQALLPAFDATVESEPAVKVLQAFAYRELLLRQQFNDRLRGILVAFATGTTLDHLAALFGVERLMVDPGDPGDGIDPTYESDDDLRQRIVIAPESYSVAGPELAYVFHAKSAAGEVLDASATTPAPGEVIVSVLSREGDGTADAELLAAVEAVVTSRAVRPVGDLVSVRSAEIVSFAVDATVYTFSGPDLSVVLAAAEQQCTAFLEESRRLGRDVPLSMIIAKLAVPGVQRVVLHAPLADITCSLLQAGHCTGVNVSHGGYDD